MIVIFFFFFEILIHSSGRLPFHLAAPPRFGSNAVPLARGERNIKGNICIYNGGVRERGFAEAPLITNPTGAAAEFILCSSL